MVPNRWQLELRLSMSPTGMCSMEDNHSCQNISTMKCWAVELVGLGNWEAVVEVLNHICEGKRVGRLVRIGGLPQTAEDYRGNSSECAGLLCDPGVGSSFAEESIGGTRTCNHKRRMVNRARCRRKQLEVVKALVEEWKRTRN